MKPVLHKVRLNIGGQVFVTTTSTLSRFPGTRLADLTPDDPAYDSESGEYFFDKSPALFGFILDGYRTGRLHVPHCTCGPYLTQEMEFWGLADHVLADCCWQAQIEAIEGAKVDAIFEEYTVGCLKGMDAYTEKDVRSRRDAIKMALWNFLECPRSSCPARIWAFFFMSVVLVSVALQCMFTHPVFRRRLAEPRRNITMETNEKIVMYLTTEFLPSLYYLDITCFAIFVVELGTRFLVCPAKTNFFKSVYNIIDVVCVSTMAVMLFVQEVFHSFIWNGSSVFFVVYLLQAFGVFRVLRLIKFARSYTGMRILMLALKASAKEILLLLMLISIGTLIFSNLIYFAEFHNEDDFYSIPVGFWWSIVTMTTVGYGDKHPVTSFGYVVGAVCAVSGILCTAIPIPIIANNFNIYYRHAKRKLRNGNGCIFQDACATKGDTADGKLKLTMFTTPSVVHPSEEDNDENTLTAYEKQSDIQHSEQ